MSRFPHLATRVFNTPLAIRPDKAEVIIASIANRFGVTRLNRADGSPIPFDVDLDDAQPGRVIDAEHGFERVAGNVAVIAIQGTLVAKLGTLQPFSGMTGYDGIRQNVLAAMADDSIDGIVFDIDSPGGEVSGCFDLVDMVAQAGKTKPIRAILTESAFSAAYALASPCRICVPRTGGVGSVGVIYAHVEMSKALESAGVTVTLITDGDFKADGNDIQPLSQRAYDKLKADVVAVGDLFRGTVAINRGMTPAAVKATQAGTFLGAQGVTVGFADAVMAPDEAMAEFVADMRRRPSARQSAFNAKLRRSRLS